MLEEIKEFIAQSDENFQSVKALLSNRASGILDEKIEQMEALLKDMKELCDARNWKIDLPFAEYDVLGDYYGTRIREGMLGGDQEDINRLLDLKEKLEGLAEEAEKLADENGLGFSVGDYTYHNRATGGAGWDGSDASC